MPGPRNTKPPYDKTRSARPTSGKPSDERRLRPDDERPRADAKRPFAGDKRPRPDAKRPPFGAKRPASDDKRRPFDAKHPPSDAKQPFYASLPRYEDKRARADDKRPRTSERPRFDDNKPRTSERPRFDDSKPRTSERPRFDDKRPRTSERPRFDDKRPRTGERPRFDDKRPRTSERLRTSERPRFDDNKPRTSERPRFDDKKPRTSERPRFDDNKPRTSERPRFDDNKPRTSERPRFDDKKPRTSERPRFDDKRPPTGERPRFDDNKPRTSERPRFEDKKPRTSERPRFDDNKPRTGERPRFDDKKPRFDDKRQRGFGPPARSSGPPEPRNRRPFSNLRGGPVDRQGDVQVATWLAEALDVVASDEPPELTHGFHTYPARFHPRLVRRLLLAQPAAARVLDPFMGSGTALVEAALAGRTGFGVDANPLAVMLARLKATPRTHAEIETLARAAAKVATHALDTVRVSRRRSARSEPPSAETRFDDPHYYPPHVYRELVMLRQTIDTVADPERAQSDPAARWWREALLLILSSIVVKFSWQRSDTDERATTERTVPRGAPSRLFGERGLELVERLAEFSDKVPRGTPTPSVHLGDARDLRPRSDASIDLVITSPPYPGTYDYAAHHARRFGWVGLDPTTLLATEIGARREADKRGPAAAITSWNNDVDRYASEIARVLVPGAFAFVLVGDSTIGDRAVAGDEALRSVVPRLGLEIVASASQERPDPWRTPRPSEAIPVRREHLLALRKA